MDSLPIPQLRSSWVAALFNAALLFLLYYVVVFNWILKLYEGQFDSVYFEASNNQLTVRSYAPQYYNSLEPTWVYIHVENKSNHPIYGIEVYLISTFSEATLLLPRLYEEETYSTGAKFDIVAPHSIAIARVSFIAQDEPVITKVLLIKIEDGTREELERLNPKEYIRINKSNLRTLQHSFLENILLPPWSNGFILALALFSAYLARKGEEVNEPEPFTMDWWDLVMGTISKSLIILSTMFMLTLAFLFASEETFLGVIALFIMLMLDLGFLESYISRHHRESLAFFSTSLAILGIVPISFQILFSGLSFFVPSDLNYLQPPISEKWSWGLGLVVLCVWCLRTWKSTEKLEMLSKQLDSWAYFFFGICMLFALVLVFNKNNNIEEYISWGILAILSLATVFRHRLFGKFIRRRKPQKKNKSKTTHTSIR